MNNVLILLLILIGTAGVSALITLFMVWFFKKPTKSTQAQTEKSLKDTQILLNQVTKEKEETEKSLIKEQTLLNQITTEKTLQNEELQKLRANCLNLEKELSSLQTEKESRQTLQNQFEVHFKNLSQNILESKSKQFQIQAKQDMQQAKQDIQYLLNPLKEKIENFQKKVEDTYSNESRERFSLKENIKDLCNTHEQLKTETLNLSKALKGDVKAQGQWGEMILSAILDASGLKEGEHYLTQGKELKMRDVEGQRQKPDVIVKLPDNKHIVIDSKVSLTHYERFITSDSKEQKQGYLSQFKLSLRAHIKGLKEKQYSLSSSLNTPDFVLMFFPIEGAFSLALQEDPKLFEFSWNKSIVVVSPTTLLATLKTVESIWKREKQNKNALEIAQVSGRLYDKFVGFTDELSEIGQHLDKAKESHHQACQKLRDGRGSIVSRLDKIKQLGAKTSKQIPESLLPPSH